MFSHQTVFNINRTVDSLDYEIEGGNATEIILKSEKIKVFFNDLVDVFTRICGDQSFVSACYHYCDKINWHLFTSK